MTNAFDPLFHVSGALLCVVVFFVIGLGPCLALLPARGRMERSFCLAPVFGFALTVIAGTLLTVLNVPVSQWAYPWLVVALGASLGLTIVVLRKKEGAELGFSADLRCLVFGFALVAVLVSSPVIRGDLQFTVMRGNVTDAFDYANAAYSLDHDKLSWFGQASPQELVDRNCAYGFGRNPLQARWTTSVPLAWCARISRMPVCPFDYAYGTAFLVLAVGPAFLMARRCGLSPWRSLLAAAAVSVGFWPQFVLDLRAVTQLYSIPLTLAVAALVLPETDAALDEPWPGESVGPTGAKWLLGILLTALVVLYLEILPLMVLGLAIFLAWRVWRKDGRGTDSQFPKCRELVSVPVCVVLAGLAGGLLVTNAGWLARRQFSLALAPQTNVQAAAFTWFYDDPWLGLWGFFFCKQNATVSQLLTPSVLRGALRVWAGLLSAVLVWATVAPLLRKRAPLGLVMLSSLCLAGVAQFLFLIFRGQTWAAAKGVSYCYPFVTLAVVAFAGWLGRERGRVPVALVRAVQVCVLAWMGLQGLLGYYRVACVARGDERPLEIIGQAQPYNDWDLTEIVAKLEEQKAQSVGVFRVGSWMSEYLCYALPPEIRVRQVEGVRNRRAEEVCHQSPFEIEALLAGKVSWNSAGNPLAKRSSEFREMASNRTLLLLQPPAGFAARPQPADR